MIVKIDFDSKKHLYRGQLNLHQVKKHCLSVFKSLPKCYDFYYFDSDGDEITVSSQQDLDIIRENWQSTSIFKLFIKQVDSEFQILSEDSNPENDFKLSNTYYCKIPKYSKQIQTLNIVKERMSVKQEEQIKKEASKFLNQVQNELISKIMNEQNQIIKDEVRKFVEVDLEKEIISKIIEQEDKIVKEEVQDFLNTLVDDCSTKIAHENIQNQEKTLRNKASQRKIKQNEQLINAIVEQKISKLIPGIVKQVTRAVEAKLIIEGCLKCQKRDSSQELQRLIKSSLRKKNYHEL